MRESFSLDVPETRGWGDGPLLSTYLDWRSLLGVRYRVVASWVVGFWAMTKATTLQ